MGQDATAMAQANLDAHVIAGIQDARKQGPQQGAVNVARQAKTLALVRIEILTEPAR
jgi:hypothetical protein